MQQPELMQETCPWGFRERCEHVVKARTATINKFCEQSIDSLTNPPRCVAALPTALLIPRLLLQKPFLPLVRSPLSPHMAMAPTPLEPTCISLNKAPNYENEF